MQNQENKAKVTYWLNGETVSKEEFSNLVGEYFKWFDGNDVKAVDYSSVEPIFNGDHKSQRQINDHLKGVLGGQFKKSRPDNTHSTRHKAKQEGRYHEYPLTPDECFSLNSVDKNCNKAQERFLESILDISKPTAFNQSDFFDKKQQEQEILDTFKRNMEGIKESQSVKKAPIFTYCKVNSLALEALAFRALYGHEKYKETDQDWQNFTRVPNAEQEYGEALFRHALNIGEDSEEEHYIASAWNAVARLEVFLRNKNKNLHNSK